MAYTDIDDPTIYFQNKIYTGNGQSGHAITFDGNSDMQPDWVWIKSRNATETSRIYDVVRGASKHIASNDNNAESTDTNGLTAFGSDGFTVGSGNPVNNNNKLYASWNWKAGTSFTNDASSTSVGSIDSAGSVNTDAGFSIIGYTGAGDGSDSSAQTIAHGLGVAPGMIIVKNRADATNWYVYHHKNTAAPATDVLYLNLDNATADDNGPWKDVAPTSSVFTVGGDNGVNGNGDAMIAYCFAEKQGYSKFSSYIGNGNADGTFVYTGFKPAFVMTKPSNKTGEWFMIDNKRDPSNYVRRRLKANGNAAENTDDNQDFDILSNGFKPRRSAGDWNSSGDTFIYIAFAEQPFVTSTGVPATAR